MLTKSRNATEYQKENKTDFSHFAKVSIKIKLFGKGGGGGKIFLECRIDKGF